MSIFQSLVIGVSGLQSQSNVINVISDNLANVNTVGYKKVSANFRTLIVNSNSPATYSPGGAIGGSRHLNSKQGEVTRTDSTTDIAIEGQGFFAVSQTVPATGISYTRAGSFAPNKTGDFVNGAGFFLQGWRLDASGNLPTALSGSSVTQSTAAAALTTINPNSITQAALPTTVAAMKLNLKSSQAVLTNSSILLQANLQSTQVALPTSNVSLVANLNSLQTAFSPLANYDATDSNKNMASGSVTPSYTRSVNVIDNTGVERSVNIGFLKTGTNTWAVEIYVQPRSDVTQTDGQLAYGTVTFNADGSLASASPALTSPVTAGWNNIGGASNINFNLGTIGALNGISQTTNTYSSVFSANPNYNASVPATNMASGAVTPHYTSTVNVLDNTGATRTLNVSYLKTGPDEWAVEVYASPLTDVTNTNGQLATGTVTFNSNGTIKSISPALVNPMQAGWNASPTANSVSFTWQPSGASTGLVESTAAYSSSLAATKNYDPAVTLNNMTSGNVQANFESPITIIDPTGVEHNIKAVYLKTAPNTWAVEMYVVPATDVAAGATSAQLASGIVTFNGDGTLASVSPGLTSAIAMNWQNGETNSVTFDWGTAGAPFGTTGATVIGLTDGLSQINSNYKNNPVVQDGSLAGALSRVEITEDGYVVGHYNNATSRRLYKIPLAIFVEPQGLESLSGNVFAESNLSGTPLFVQPGQQNAGTLRGEALESSNVEVEDQLTNMIIAQRAYQSNSKTVSTSDDMLKTLTQMLG